MANEFNVSSDNNSNFEKADAFLNLELHCINKETGESFRKRLEKGVALKLTKAFDEAMIEFARQNPDHEFTLSGKIHIVDESKATDLSNIGF